MTKEERLKAAEAYVKKRYGWISEEQSKVFQSHFLAGAEAEAESKWVRVEDRLPEPEQRLLVVANKGFVFIMYYGLLNEKGDYGWFYYDEVIKPYMTPTHWQPLPSPPLNQQ